jgi:serine/threonine-protein kinase
VSDEADPARRSGPAAEVATAPQVAAPPCTPLPTFDGYEVEAKLGAGGMGTVFRALQLSTGRTVAVKVLHPAIFGSDNGRQLFEREVELTARLSHPHIARIYESGLHEGAYYYVMEYVDGLPLHDYTTQKGLTRRETLRLMQRVCKAVQYAHEHGIIHRDLKPTNILVDPKGDPRVLDFGLAKTVHRGDDTITVPGEIAGTPSYMSPEQASGASDRLDTRSDVYSLGVILYRLLAGRLPYDDSGGYLQILRRINEDEPLRPRTADPSLDRELEALLMKALARDPLGRYATAGELARDLANYLHGEPLMARPPTLAYFVKKRAARHKGALALLTCALFLLGVLAGYDRARLRTERDRAETSRRKIQREHTHAKERVARLQRRLHAAQAALAAGNSPHPQ